MLLNILLVILVLDCIALTAVILLQRSEGGALGMGGGPSGMFTARGAGDLLTRTTSILTTVFFVLSLAITLLAGHNHANSSVTQRMQVNPIDLNALAHPQGATPPATSAPAAPPLPTAAPPLPTTAAPAAMPTQPPRPSARVPAQAPLGQNLGAVNVPPPAGVTLPRTDVTGSAAGTGQVPAGQAPAHQ
jgi:preprotein translocase subunit SecG